MQRGSNLKAIQINGYSKEIRTMLGDIPMPRISDSEVLIRVKAAAANPVDLLIMAGDISLEQADAAVRLVAEGQLNGKVIIQL